MFYIPFNSILPTPFSVCLPGISQQPLMVPVHCLWHASLKMFESMERMMGREQIKECRWREQGQPERWSRHFAKDSMSWATWAEKEEWPRGTIKEKLRRKIQLERGHAMPGGWVIIESCSHFSFLPIIPPVLCFSLLVTVSLLPGGEERKLIGHCSCCYPTWRYFGLLFKKKKKMLKLPPFPSKSHLSLGRHEISLKPT